jgi:hypothetical protein
MKPNTRTAQVRVRHAFVSFLLTAILITIRFDHPTPALAQSCAHNEHTGIISSDERWCAADNPHQLNADVTVSGGVILTIEPGVVVKAENSVELLVVGTLNAVGSNSKPIEFTSTADSGPGQWSGIVVDGGDAQLTHATVRYSGQPNSIADKILGAFHPGAGNRSNITVRNGALQLENSTVRDVVSASYDYGLIAHDSIVIIRDTHFTGIGGGDTPRDVPLALSGPNTVLDMTGTRFTGNANDRVWLYSSAMMGHDTLLQAQPAMDGYEYRNDFFVPPGITLTLEAGVILKSAPSSNNQPKEFIIQGHLEALGTPEKPITFTSMDDSGSGQWPGLIFDGGTGHLRHATVRYGGMRNRVTDTGSGHWARSNIAIRNVDSGSVHLEQVTVSGNASPDQNVGVYVINGNLLAEKCTFTGIGDGTYYGFPDTPIYIAGQDSEVTLTDNTFTANSHDGVVLRAGAMMGHDTRLTSQEGLAGYVLEDDFIVPKGVTLTVDPGVTVMGGLGAWGHGAELRVEGHLDATGTAAQPITFTSYENSAPNQWAGLVFDGTDGEGTGRLRHATVRYGGRGNSVLEILPGYHSGNNITIYNVKNGEVRLDHVLVEKEYHFDGWHKFVDHGIHIHEANVSVVDSTVEDNCDSTGAGPDEDSGVYVNGSSKLTIVDSLIQSNSAPGLIVEGDTATVEIHGSSIVNNIGDGVRNLGKSSVILGGAVERGNAVHSNQGYGVHQAGSEGGVVATYNWWGHASGPQHADNPSGSGQAVTDRVIYDPWLRAKPGSPGAVAQMVQLAAPNEISVGQTVNLGILFENLDTKTLKDAILVLEIPWRAEYIDSTPDGHFWPLHNHVVWKLGDVVPGDTFGAIAQVRYRWGTPNWTVMPVSAMVAAANMSNERVTYAEHLAYEELSIVDERELNQGEVDAILAADETLKRLHQQLLDRGFDYYGNATMQTLDGGVEWFELLYLDKGRGDAIAALRRIDNDRHIRLETSHTVELFNESGGATFDFDTAKWSFSGDLIPSVGASSDSIQPIQGEAWHIAQGENCRQHNWGDCLRNCLIDQIPREMNDPGLFAGSNTCKACVACDEFCLDVCSDCARDLWKEHQHEHYHDCTRECADSSNWNNYQCDQDRVECYDAPKNETKTGRSQYRIVYECDEGSCKYEPNPKLEYCPRGCTVGDTAGKIRSECIDCDDFWDFATEEQCTRALTAHDPNALDGPVAATPGQVIDYEVEWENEGQGIAFGVYVESSLPLELDESTLQIGGNGVYDPATRLIRWSIGELGAGAGDSVTYSARVPSSTAHGTVLVANATVYFPSVPEVTPTNPVVTLIQPVAAERQRLTVSERVPKSIQLSGQSPSGKKLSFSITKGPFHGALTGTPPNVTYKAAADSEGADLFLFTASDGTNTSEPVPIDIVIQAGPDQAAPRVIATSPYAGEANVQITASALYGDVYAPIIWSTFNEPLDEKTVTSDSYYVVDASAQRIASTVTYDAESNRALLQLNAPLKADSEYRVVLTADVADTTGNTMSSNHTWRFSTGSFKQYLPAVLRQ